MFILVAFLWVGLFWTVAKFCANFLSPFRQYLQTRVESKALGMSTAQTIFSVAAAATVAYMWCTLVSVLQQTSALLAWVFVVLCLVTNCVPSHDVQHFSPEAMFMFGVALYTRVEAVASQAHVAFDTLLHGSAASDGERLCEWTHVWIPSDAGETEELPDTREVQTLLSMHPARHFEAAGHPDVPPTFTYVEYSYDEFADYACIVEEDGQRVPPLSQEASEMALASIYPSMATIYGIKDVRLELVGPSWPQAGKISALDCERPLARLAGPRVDFYEPEVHARVAVDATVRHLAFVALSQASAEGAWSFPPHPTGFGYTYLGLGSGASAWPARLRWTKSNGEEHGLDFDLCDPCSEVGATPLRRVFEAASAVASGSGSDTE